MCFDGFNIIVPGMGRGVGVLCVWGVQIIVFSSVSLFLLIDTSVLFLSFFQNKNFWNLGETGQIMKIWEEGHIKRFRLFYFWFQIRENKRRKSVITLYTNKVTNFSISSSPTLMWCQHIIQKAIELGSIQFQVLESSVSLDDAKGRWKSDFRENCRYIK